MDRRKATLFYLGPTVWGIFILALVVYFFFPYQRAFKIALQNVVGNGRAVISMEGVTMKALGIRASKVLIQPDPANGQRPFELTDIYVTWNPLSLVRGNLRIRSVASLYGGVLQSTVDGIQFAGQSAPTITLTLKHVNMAKVPDGAIPWLRSITGILDGTVRRRSIPTASDRQVGSFRLVLREGEIRDLHVKGLPRLIIPCKEVSAEGTTDGSRIDLAKILLTSDVVSIRGSGVIDSADPEQGINMRLYYRASSGMSPFKGQGNIQISGSPSSPVVVMSGTDKVTQGGR